MRSKQAPNPILPKLPYRKHVSCLALNIFFYFSLFNKRYLFMKFFWKGTTTVLRTFIIYLKYNPTFPLYLNPLQG